MKEQLETLLTEATTIFTEINDDVKKFIEKDNKAAGTRVRTGSMDLIKKLKEIRTKVSEIKNS